MKRRIVLKGYSAIRKKRMRFLHSLTVFCLQAGSLFFHCFASARVLYCEKRNLAKHYEEHREVWSVKCFVRMFCESKMCTLGIRRSN